MSHLDLIDPAARQVVREEFLGLDLGSQCDWIHNLACGPKDDCLMFLAAVDLERPGHCAVIRDYARGVRERVHSFGGAQ